MDKTDVHQVVIQRINDVISMIYINTIKNKTHNSKFFILNKKHK
jgi:hypothetical protein